MKHTHQKTLSRTLIALLALLLAAVCMLNACASSGKTLMQIGKTELSSSTYELLLSRMKGTLAYNGYEVGNDEFWNYIWSTGGATYDDYFRAEILEAAKDMLLRLYLFEEVYELTLPQSYYDEVDVYMADLLENDFNSSKSAFNQAMAEYGVNMDILRENYILEDKLEYLSTYLSARTADTAREEYYNEHYVCFRQILFPLYEYQYKTDENGDLIYYKKGTNFVAYDTVNGQTKTATDGTLRTDADGNTMYFHEDGSIAYDTKNGELTGLDEDNDGYVDYVELRDEEIQNVVTNAETLRDLLEDGDFSSFEMYGEEYAGDDGIWKAYPGGIFLNDAQEYSLAYLNELSGQLKDAQVGQVILFRSESAYHLVMKYPLAEGAWGVKENEDWFGTFEEEVIESILLSLCAEYADDIVVDEAVLASTKSMKEIGANWNY